MKRLIPKAFYHPISVFIPTLILLIGVSGCKTYVVDEISLKKDFTASLSGHPPPTFSVEIGNDFVVFTQMHEGKIAAGPKYYDYDKTNKYKMAMEWAIIKEMTSHGFLHEPKTPRIRIIYVINFSGKYIGGYSKNWTISIGGYDWMYQRVLFEVTGTFRSNPELDDELASAFVADLINALDMAR